MHQVRALLIQIGIVLFLSFTYCKNKDNDMEKIDIITNYEELSKLDGRKVVIIGTYVKYDPLPHLVRNDIEYHSGILLEGEESPNIFLENPRSEKEQEEFNGKKVRVVGTFYLTQPLKSGQTETTAKYKGSWVYNVDSVELMKD